jgi:hypothetical protein
MTIELPPYKFDSSLKEDPVDTVQWNSFIHDLLEQLKSSKRMEIYESLGMALRVARRFDEIGNGTPKYLWRLILQS